MNKNIKYNNKIRKINGEMANKQIEKDIYELFGIKYNIVPDVVYLEDEVMHVLVNSIPKSKEMDCALERDYQDCEIWEQNNAECIGCTHHETPIDSNFLKEDLLLLLEHHAPYCLNVNEVGKISFDIERLKGNCENPVLKIDSSAAGTTAKLIIASTDNSYWMAGFYLDINKLIDLDYLSKDKNIKNSHGNYWTPIKEANGEKVKGLHTNKNHRLTTIEVSNKFIKDLKEINLIWK